LSLLAALLLSSCDFFNDLFGLTSEYPDIPEPESYIAAVPETSDELIVATVALTDFVPLITEAADDEGNMQDITDARIQLVLNGNPVSSPDTGNAKAHEKIQNTPYLQMVRYWKRLGDPLRYSGATTTTTSISTTKGSETTETYSFGISVGVSATVEAGAIFASVSTTVSTEFESEYSTEITISESETVTKEYTVEAAQDENLVFCVWQLIEEYRIVASIDGEWVTYEDPSYVFDESSIEALVVPTDNIKNISYSFPNTPRELK